MTHHYAKHGQTYVLSGTLASTDTLAALSGVPGGVIDVAGYAKNTTPTASPVAAQRLRSTG